MDVDSTLVRLLVVALVIVSGGLGLLAYIAAWIIVPTEPLPPAVRSQPNAAPSAS
jgi:phage shock protein PspC (stress-responsive transcriptional regulator)